MNSLKIFRAGTPPLSREHGSWAVLCVPLVAGIVVANHVTAQSVLVVLGGIGLFLAHYPVELLLLHGPADGADDGRRRSLLFWAVAYALLGGACSMAAVAGGFWGLVPLGVLAAATGAWRFWVLRHRGKGIRSDWIGAAGLSLGAPATFYVSAGTMGWGALLSWVVCVLFFGSTVVYVHMKIVATKRQRPGSSWPSLLSAGKLNLAYHGAVITLITVSAIAVGTPAALLVSLGPMTIHALWGMVRLKRKTDFRRLGLILVVQSFVFVVLLALWGKEGIPR